MQGLQAHHVRTMESHLRLVIKNSQRFTSASKQATETHGFAAAWGGRQVCSWTRQWMKTRELPKSMQGHHSKVYSLLSDPTIAAELRAYIHSNKWAMNPEKLAQFSQNTLIPSAANEYLHQITHKEMLLRLKQYMELELFPRIHVKVGRGVSLNTARCWLWCEGFRYISHKKGLYFDGHDRPDVVSYRQDHFLPTMKKHKPRLIHYTIGNVEKELEVKPANYVEQQLVLIAHDKMTAQANESNGKSWVFGDEHHLRKKGVGRGIHKSNVICSTTGWLKEASQTLEYGKNYEGYWTGELFVKQV